MKANHKHLTMMPWQGDLKVNIQNAKGRAKAYLGQTDEPIPEPLATRRFSGTFMVRVPPEVHRDLAVEAAEAGISLNRLAPARLAQ